jgi:hypothetical protein
MEAVTAEAVPTGDAGGPRFVSIEYFWRDMLGFKSKQWFYQHKDDPGMPQRVYIGSDPKLVYDECVAYMHRLMAARAAKPKPKRKRHTGRPAGPARAG